jgi:hypothetical protein
MHPDVVRIVPITEHDITTRSVLRLKCPLCGGEREAEVVVLGHRDEGLVAAPFRRDWLPDCTLCGKRLRLRSEVGAT